MSIRAVRERFAALLRVISRSGVHLADQIRWERYRAMQSDRGVHLHHRCRVVGAHGVRLNRGAHIHTDAVLATSNISEDSGKLYTKPVGYIEIGEDSHVLPGAILASYGGRIVVGKKCSVNPYCVLYGHGGLVIGDKTRIAAQTVIIPANHRYRDWDTPIMDQGLDCRGIVIGNDVWIGASVTILDGVIVGDHAVVAAGAVVNKPVPVGAVVAGVPARIVGTRTPSNAPASFEDDAER